ncbi:uncharacterized protein [Agelaius tricolor]|uniref:uncharacterized protein n=1 Tax=Agelaius tricolor TaxID=9191 RepID=UPI0039F188FA
MPSPIPAEAACPRRPVCGAGSCGPCPVPQAGAPACAPHAAPLPGPCGLFSRLLWPQGRCRWRPEPAGLCCGAAPRLAGPSAPCRARRLRLLAGPQGSVGRGSSGGRRQRPAQGQGPHQPFPSVPRRSLQLAEDRSRAAEQLRLALPYVRSAQEPLREAAVRFMGMAGRFLTGQQPHFRIICRALQDMTDDTSPAISCLALQALYILLALQSVPGSRLQKMRDQLRRLWHSRPLLCGRG